MTGSDSTAQRLVAERLSAASDAALAELFRLRRIPAHAAPSTGWRDLFDVAEHMLEPASIDLALAALPRNDIATLISGRASREILALTDAEGAPLAPVARRLAGTEVDPQPQTIPEPADAVAGARAAERAFTTLASLADILLAALATPFGRIGTGALSVTERRRIVELGLADTAADADLFVRLALETSLMAARERQIGATASGERWLSLATPERWAMLAAGLRDALPAGLRTDDGGWISPSLWPAAYPFDAGWPKRAAELLDFMGALGLMAGESEPEWAQAMRAGGAPQPDALVALMPHEVDRVFLQNDLTAISPGPLAPTLDARLRTMAERESRAQASGYRFTAASIARALSAGETAESMHEFLASLSLTGVPQPLAYLIDHGASRHGLVRVVADPAGGTVVRSADATLLRTIEVDSALASLGLIDAGDGLRSGTARDVVFWALADAKYPVVAEDADGQRVRRERHRVFDAPAAATPYGELISRLREHQGADPEAAWLDRELAAAIRAKTSLRIVINMPGGTTREVVLEPIGLGGGRLRGRDTAADVERTLPVALIHSVKPA